MAPYPCLHAWHQLQPLPPPTPFLRSTLVQRPLLQLHRDLLLQWPLHKLPRHRQVSLPLQTLQRQQRTRQQRRNDLMLQVHRRLRINLPLRVHSLTHQPSSILRNLQIHLRLHLNQSQQSQQPLSAHQRLSPHGRLQLNQ